MSKQIFISCVHEDSGLISNLERWAKNKLLGENVKISHETQDVRSGGYDAIWKHLRNKIEGASIVLVLIGRDTHNHDWIRAEVELANSFHKKIIVAQIPGTKGGLPPILRNYSVVPFDPSTLSKLI